ncbi:hypothetical protein CONPUDRAFT_138520 [Coniophora puteana RWD-64-598 SS2]|uniref:F-box domain-containing protein n=1 Tax=Coniophora puteana (strain RWD-64-598) TaxID=741705 RepID=A0A5M3MJJ3_CONPW|nr:uncharacterized protein CONPUDRAFT_138520 [Coniophora puteana RWD-64-598 SS2]EIW79408.1 hypothetical protein CONPUDRAFT_138520 [Coniophora puteana RWD-64-598 SS2]
MHKALLIDELIQLLFDICLEDSKGTLCYLARCCKAWKDPALDRIWRRLPSAAPLLALVQDSENAEPTTPVFTSYANRVRHVTHQQASSCDVPSFSCNVSDYEQTLKTYLSKLASVRVDYSSTGTLHSHLMISPRLQRMELDLGFRRSTRTSSNALHASFLLKEAAAIASLERLSVRGITCPAALDNISSVKTLRALCLHVSCPSMTTALISIGTLPALTELNIHTGHVSADAFTQAFEDKRLNRSSFFPSLTTLKIRASPQVLEALASLLAQHTLKDLSIEAEQPVGPPSSWLSAFQAISSNLSDTLDALTIEHSIDSIELEQADDTLPPAKSCHFTLENLRPLSNLPLRRFVLDSLLPPDMTDSDIVELAKWWPRLEHLELGHPDALNSVDEQWHIKATPSSLVSLASGCRNLERLVLSIDASHDVSRSTSLRNHPLSHLTIGSRLPPHQSVEEFVRLSFPSLTEFHPGLEDLHADCWRNVCSSVVTNYDN